MVDGSNTILPPQTHLPVRYPPRYVVAFLRILYARLIARSAETDAMTRGTANLRDDDEHVAALERIMTSYDNRAKDEENSEMHSLSIGQSGWLEPEISLSELLAAPLTFWAKFRSLRYLSLAVAHDPQIPEILPRLDLDLPNLRELWIKITFSSDPWSTFPSIIQQLANCLNSTFGSHCDIHVDMGLDLDTEDLDTPIGAPDCVFDTERFPHELRELRLREEEMRRPSSSSPIGWRKLEKWERIGQGEPTSHGADHSAGLHPDRKAG